MPVATSIPRAKGLSSATPSQMRALWIAIAIMFGLAAGSGWLVLRGLTQGDTWIPAKHIARQRHVQRAQEPGIFWLSVAVYGAVAAGTFGLGAWGTREALRLRRSASRH
jgi:hypothetical protein